MSKEWQELRLRSAQPEALAEILEACGALAVTLQDAADNPVLEPAPGQTPLWPQTQLIGLFAADADREDVENRLMRGGGELIISSHWDELPEQVWERAWLEHFQPLCFGRRLRVAAHEHTVPDDERVTLRLDPGLAFGTGTHPTTALCLEWLGSAELSGLSVLDYGCGSGILALAAKSLGAASCSGCDIDPQALLATRANAQGNGLTLDLISCEQALDRQYDLVLANILATPLIDLGPQIAATVAPGGELLLAGLLRDQADAVAAAYPGFEFKRRHKDDWTLLWGCRKDCD